MSDASAAGIDIIADMREQMNMPDSQKRHTLRYVSADRCGPVCGIGLDEAKRVRKPSEKEAGTGSKDQLI